MASANPPAPPGPRPRRPAAGQGSQEDLCLGVVKLAQQGTESATQLLRHLRRALQATERAGGKLGRKGAAALAGTASLLDEIETALRDELHKLAEVCGAQRVLQKLGYSGAEAAERGE
jgi:hypothetical protein